VDIIGVPAVPRVAAAISSGVSADVLLIFEMNESPEVRVGADNDMSAPAAVTAVRAALW
jgi:hypothetical protein